MPKFRGSIFVSYSFQWTGLLNTSYNTFTSFALSLLDKVTIGAYNFVFVILNVETPTTLDITQYFIQLNSRLVLQLINGISNDPQKSPKYFSGTAIFIFLNTPLPAAPKVLKKLDLYLKGVQLVVLTLTVTPLLILCSSLLNCYKLPEVSE